MASSQARAGELVNHTIQSEKLLDNQVGLDPARDFTVLLPDGYNQSDRDYPVVYWFPGASQRPTSNLRPAEIDAEFASGRSLDAIVVFMDTQSEFNSSLFLSTPVFGDWEGHLVDEVIPFVDTNYRTEATQDGRGIMGFSLGGFTSLLMPIFQPGVFGAVGANDPGVSFTSGSVRTRDEFPEGYQPGTSPRTIEEFFEDFPDTPTGYGDSLAVTSGYGQLAVKLAPNPESPLLGDIPFGINEDGLTFWNVEARELWRQYDLLNPDSVAVHADAFRDLSTVSVVLPETAVNTSRAWSAAMLREFDKVGIRTNAIEFAGDHNDFQQERFVALLGDVTYALQGENRIRLVTRSYRESFDGLSEAGDETPTALPAGWSVGIGATSVFRDKTNTAFNAGNIEAVGAGPRILNLGDDADRGLGIHLATADETAAIQLLADIGEFKSNAVELKFDIEAWDKVMDAAETSELDQVGFRVRAEFDFGEGLESMIDFGTVAIDDLSPLSEVAFDGNAEENRERFTLLGGAPFADAQAVRVVFEADQSTTTPGWVYGLDDVELDFSFRGDFDGDGELTLGDINLLGAATRNTGLSNFDVNSDGTVDSDDVEFWVLGLYGTTLGDANLDNSIDFTDFLRISANFGTEEPVVWEDGDFDGDGFVGFSDFLAFARGFNLGVDQTEVAPVPEPTSLGSATLGSALILFFWITTLRRKRGR